VQATGVSRGSEWASRRFRYTGVRRNKDSRDSMIHISQLHFRYPGNVDRVEAAWATPAAGQ